MVKFELIQDKPEDTVITTNAQSTIMASGQTVKVGTHFVSFSGRAMVAGSDVSPLITLAKGKDDDQITQFDCEVIVGPSWTEIYQCSFQISGGKYTNLNSDEDDWQGWEVRASSWEIVQQGTTKKIRLKFSLAQYGQYTIFQGVSYHVIATGDIGTSPPPIPVLCDQPLNNLSVDSTGSISPHTADKAIDGHIDTWWTSTVRVHPRIMISWTRKTKVCRVDIRWYGVYQNYFRIAILAAGGGWTDVYSGKSTGNDQIFEKYEFTEQESTAVEITITESDPAILPKSQAYISEINIFGKPD